MSKRPWARPLFETLAVDAEQVKVLDKWSGQAYRVWRLRLPEFCEKANSNEVIFRRAHYPTRADNWEEELCALELLSRLGLSPEIAPLLLGHGQSRKSARVWMITSFMVGQRVSPASWDKTLLSKHAQTLARLHRSATFHSWGSLAHPQRRHGQLDLESRFSKEIEFWRCQHGELFDDELTKLSLKVKRVLADCSSDFAKLSDFSLVHGDLGCTNIVFGADQPRYIDWEWAQVDDPVRDLIYVGGLIGAKPWYAQLKPAQIRLLVKTHAHYYGANWQVEMRRRDAWEVYERFLSSLDFATRRGSPADGDGRYTRAVANIWQGLDTWVGLN